MFKCCIDFSQKGKNLEDNNLQDMKHDIER